MGKCETKIIRVSFDFSDEEVTKVVVESDFQGDCPLGMKRLNEKTFPARYSAVDLMTMEGGVKDYLVW